MLATKTPPTCFSMSGVFLCESYLIGSAMTTRRSPQLWVISTAGNDKSVYLWRKVLAGRAACTARSHGRVCYLEWSAPDSADIDDPETAPKTVQTAMLVCSNPPGARLNSGASAP